MIRNLHSIHRFTKNKNEPNGAYLWTGSIGDKTNPKITMDK